MLANDKHAIIKRYLTVLCVFLACFGKICATVLTYIHPQTANCLPYLTYKLQLIMQNNIDNLNCTYNCKYRALFCYAHLFAYKYMWILYVDDRKITHLLAEKGKLALGTPIFGSEVAVSF